MSLPNLENVNWERFLSPENLEGEPEVIGSSFTLTTTGSQPNIGISPDSGTSIEIDDTQPLSSGDSIIIRDDNPVIRIGDQPEGRWDQLQPQNPFGASPQPNPWAPIQQPFQQPFQQPQIHPLGYPIVEYPVGYPEDCKPIKKEWDDTDVIVFLESLGVISEKTMKKIKNALKPVIPIVHNNRIDDLIFDIEE